MLDDQEAVVFLLQMVISWKDVKAQRTSNSVKLQSSQLRVQSAGVVAADEGDQMSTFARQC